MTLIISVDGVDITDDVMIEDARFTMASGPSPGDFEFRVKDAAKTYDFRAAQTCDVDFQGVRVFEGFVFYAVMGHAFPADDTVTNGPSPVERIWTLRGSDLNVLFRKRVIFDQDSPSSPIALNLAAGTSDLTYLNAIVDHLTLVDDNLTFDFNAVGTPNPDRAGIAISIGDSWERVMALTAEIPGAVWGIRPPRTVYYEDNDTETAPFAISDTPDDVTSFGYSNFDWLNDGSHLVNDAKIWGVGLGHPWSLGEPQRLALQPVPQHQRDTRCELDRLREPPEPPRREGRRHRRDVPHPQARDHARRQGPDHQFDLRRGDRAPGPSVHDLLRQSQRCALRSRTDLGHRPAPKPVRLPTVHHAADRHPRHQRPDL
jgi:hypothetical protein